MNQIFIIHRKYKPEDLFRPKVATSLQLNGSSGHCLLYKLTGFQNFQETFFIKMDRSHDHFYKTLKVAKTAIKQYSKVHYFIRLIRPRRITKLYSLIIAPNE